LLLFFHKVSFIIDKLFFPPLCEILFAGHIKRFAEASELCMHIAFQPVAIHKMVSLEYLFRGPKRWKLEGAISVL